MVNQSNNAQFTRREVRVLRIHIRSKRTTAQRDPHATNPPSTPFDPTEIRFSTKFFSLHLLLTRIQEGDLDLSPAFQRNEVWTDETASRLIESLLIRIPLPAFYVDASGDDYWTVIDGQQRLTALTRFVYASSELPEKLRSLQRLRLRGLEYLTQYEGMTFSELSRGLQRRILETQVTVSLVEHGTPEEVKFNIFKRINTGGVPLSAQEIRHAMFQGPATDTLTRLAKSESFKAATGHGVSTKRMADEEFILRALAFMLTPYDRYDSKSFDKFLNGTMNQLNRMSESDRTNLEEKFLHSIQTANMLFGAEAFRKKGSKGKRQAVNKALFEAWTVQLANLTPWQRKELVTPKRCKKLLQRFDDLLKDPGFLVSISVGTEKQPRVHTRFAGVERLLKEVLS